MKIVFYFLFLLLSFSHACAKARTFTGSTPAGRAIRTVLGIPLKDSVDFIRWKVVIYESTYELQCNYGIGKPNTNGFIKGGNTIGFSGALTKQNKYYRFKMGRNILNAIEINGDLIHLMDAQNNLLVGNGGWSYTLNNNLPSASILPGIIAGPLVFKDSMVFEGRTPCNVPQVVAHGEECYKLKWLIVFYAGRSLKDNGRYRVSGTAWSRDYNRGGAWRIIKGKKGETVYELKDDRGDAVLNLFAIGDSLLLFADSQGKLLVGNEDFSYTLNRRW